MQLSLTNLSLVLQNVRGDADATKDLGKSQEILPQSEPTQLSLKLEATIELEEYPAQEFSSHTMVEYRLVAIVFRIGGYGSGHFYLAAQSAPGRWLVYNSTDISGPYSLDDVQAQHGQNVYGVGYLCKDMPVMEDRQTLAHWLQQPQNAEAARYIHHVSIGQTLVAFVAYVLRCVVLGVVAACTMPFTMLCTFSPSINQLHL